MASQSFSMGGSHNDSNFWNYHFLGSGTIMPADDVYGNINIDISSNVEYEGALRFNEEKNTIERFQGNKWITIGHGLIHESDSKKIDGFELDGAL